MVVLVCTVNNESILGRSHFVLSMFFIATQAGGGTEGEKTLRKVKNCRGFELSLDACALFCDMLSHLFFSRFVLDELAVTVAYDMGLAICHIGVLTADRWSNDGRTCCARSSV